MMAEGRGLEPLTHMGGQLSKLLPRPVGRLPNMSGLPTESNRIRGDQPKTARATRTCAARVGAPAPTTATRIQLD